MKKVDKVRKAVNDAFRDKLNEAFKEKFDRELTTELHFLSMRLVSHPTDGKKFTKTQKDWVQTFSEGYACATDQIWE